jgi:transposase
LDDALPNGLYASSGARPISAPPRLGQRRPAEGYRGRKAKSVDCVRIVHVLRDVQYAIDAGEAAFAPALRRLLCWAVAVGRRRADLKDTTLAQDHATAERRLDRLVAMPVTTLAGAKLMRQTKRWRGQFFTFMTDRQVPPTNNGAERALRPSVVFRKVTSGFRSLWGADVHALTRSVIGTARLNGIAAYQAIENALSGTVSFLG